MKMVCIKKGVWMTRFPSGRLEPSKHRNPNYGEIVEVEGTARSLADGKLVYFLKGYDQEIPHGWRQRFNPCNFRKIVDDKAEACDADFLKQLTPA